MNNEKVPRIVILGCGAVGMALGSALADRSLSPHFIDQRSANAASRSVRSSWNGGNEREYTATIVPASRLTGSPEVILVCVRVPELRGSLSSLENSALASVPAVIVANGLNLLEDLDLDRPLLRATAFFGATKTSANSIRCYGKPSALLGAVQGKDSAFAVAKVMKACGIEIEVAKSVQEVEWKKLPVNLVVNLLATLENKENGIILDRPDLTAQVHLILAEFSGVATALGMPPPENLTEFVFSSIEQHAHNINSTLMDIRAGRPLELPWIAGRFLQVAAGAGLSTPTVEKLYKRFNRI